MSNLIDCPACEGLHPAGQACECGYCDHAGTPAGVTCPACGELVLEDLIAELLDAADQVLTEMAGGWEPLAATRLRNLVTRMQGLAGIRVTSQENAPC